MRKAFNQKSTYKNHLKISIHNNNFTKITFEDILMLAKAQASFVNQHILKDRYD